MEMGEDSVPALWPVEVDDEQSPARFQHSSDLGTALAANRSGQVMQHHRAEHGIEARIRKGKRLDESVREYDADAGSS